MSIATTLVSRSIRLVSALSPSLAGRLALRAFLTTSPRMAVREADAATDLAARREYVRVRGLDVATYCWGSGGPTVLLMHGWQGRASQFATLVRELVSAGFRVVAFDAPAHGASEGRFTDVRDWIDVSARLHRRFAFDAIIGHSFGGFAALTAARTTTPVSRVAVIAAAASPSAYLEEFAAQLRLGAATRGRLERLFHARIGETAETATARYDTTAHPLPPSAELLIVHDREDPRMPDADAVRLHSAHGHRSRMLRTSGLGHTRILGADRVLDAVVAFTAGGLAAVDGVREDDVAGPATARQSSAAVGNGGTAAARNGSGAVLMSTTSSTIAPTSSTARTTKIAIVQAR